MHKCSRVIIVVVHVGAVKIYVAEVEALQKKKERQDEIHSVYHQKKLVEILLWFQSYYIS